MRYSTLVLRLLYMLLLGLLDELRNVVRQLHETVRLVG